MQRLVPSWLVPLLWSLVSVSAGGALWYFLSRREHLLAGLAAACAVVLAFVAVCLHRLSDRALRFKKERERLASFIEQAQLLLARSTEEPLPISEYKKWVARVEDYLKEHLDASYAVRFGDFSGMTFYGDGSQRSNYRNWLEGRSKRLHEFISELAD